MNSIFDLNTYSATGVYHTDDRSYSITFSNATPINSNITLFENQQHSVIPGTDITTLVSLPATANVIYAVNLAAVSGAQVTWPAPLPGTVASAVVNSNTYETIGVNGVSLWNQLKSPLVVMPNRFANNWSYTTTVNYPSQANTQQTNSKSWTTTVTVIRLSQLPFTVANSYYSPTALNLISNVPQVITPTYSGAVTNNYTLFISANISSVVGMITTTSNLGGTSVFDSTTRTMTVTGNIAQLNDRLNNLKFQGAGLGTEAVAQLNYSLTNPAIEYVSTTSQVIVPSTAGMTLTPPSEYFYPATFTANTVTGVPQITGGASIATDMLTVAITGNAQSTVNNFTTTSTEGGTVINDGTTMIITGNVAAINDRLNHISYLPNTDAPWTATYSLNSGSSYPATVTQRFSSGSLRYLSDPNAMYYNENEVDAIVNDPRIVDTSSSSSGNYTLVITPNTASAISTITSTSGQGTFSFNNTSKTTTITGTQSQINDQLSQIRMLAGTDYMSNFLLNYQLTTNTGNTAIRQQAIYFGNVTTPTSNLAVNRSYVSNTADQLLFANQVPQITEVIIPTPTYSVNLTTTAGYFGYSNATVSSSMTITGSPSIVNTALALVKFYPKKNVIGNQTFTFAQTRNSTQQFVNTIGLIGTARTTAITGTQSLMWPTPGTYTFVWSPNYEQQNYLSVDMIVCGAGGAGGSAYYLSSGGGGGAGGYYNLSNISLPAGTYTITVGAGGAGNYLNGGASSITGGSINYQTTGGGQGSNGNSDYTQPGGSGGAGGLPQGGNGNTGVAWQTYGVGVPSGIIKGGTGAGGSVSIDTPNYWIWTPSTGGFSQTYFSMGGPGLGGEWDGYIYNIVYGYNYQGQPTWSFNIHYGSAASTTAPTTPGAGGQGGAWVSGHQPGGGQPGAAGIVGINFY